MSHRIEISRDEQLVRGVLAQVQAVDALRTPILERIGRYRLTRPLGEGGMGIVYAAEQDEPRRTVALKLIRPDRMSQAAQRRFQREAQALGRLQHAGIAQIFEAGLAHTEYGERPYFAMELVEGESITSYAAGRQLTVTQRLELLAEVCDAVQHAHEQQIVHRDLKPANVLVDARGRVKILDFGVARALDVNPTGTTLQTDLGQLIGTLPYMSPEQVRGDATAVDRRSDVYSLGVLAYELLSARLPLPVRGKPLIEAARIIRDDEPATLSSLDSNLRGDVELIVAKCLAKEPDRRYQTAADLGLDLRRHLRGERPIARRPTVGYQLARFARRHRALVAATLAVLGAISAGLVVSLRLYWLAEQRLTDLTQLADGDRVAELRAEIRRIPATDENVRVLEDWVQRGEALVRRLPQHRKTLEALEALGHPEAPDSPRRRRVCDAQYAEIDDVRRLYDSAAARLRLMSTGLVSVPEQLVAQVAAEADAYRVRIDRLMAEIESTRVLRFDDPADEWQHRSLLRLIDEVEQFADPSGNIGTLGWGRAQLAFARNVKRRSIDEHAAAWSEVIAAIADPRVSPAFNGLRMTPQEGLAPIGRDPQSGLWEFSVIQTGETPQRDAAGRLVMTEQSALVLVLLPGGTFDMGAAQPSCVRPDGTPNADPFAANFDGPVTAVSLDAFFVSKFEMTQGQWLRFTGENPSMHKPPNTDGDEPISLLHPVESVSWTTVDEVLARLGLSIPTAAQWEYAARGGTTTPWWFGLDPRMVAGAENLADRVYGSRRPAWEKSDSWHEDGFHRHAPVGRFRANAFGLHDVLGNVTEWTYDGSCSYSVPARPGDGLRFGVLMGSGLRTARGGNFHRTVTDSRSGGGSAWEPSTRFEWCGVRPARKLIHPDASALAAAR